MLNGARVEPADQLERQAAKYGQHQAQRRAAALAAGESSAIRRLQYGGLLRDALRGALLTSLGLLAAWVIDSRVRLDGSTALGLTLVAVGCALSAAGGGALRSAGRGARLRWLAAGAVVGLVLAVLA